MPVRVYACTSEVGYCKLVLGDHGSQVLKACDEWQNDYTLCARGYSSSSSSSSSSIPCLSRLSHTSPLPGVSTSDHLLDLACGDLPGRGRLESQRIMSELKAAYADRTIGGWAGCLVA